MTDDLVERVIDAMSNCGSETVGSRMARAAIAVALEEAAKVVTEHYQELCTEHRLLLVNRAAAIRALVKEPA